MAKKKDGEKGADGAVDAGKRELAVLQSKAKFVTFRPRFQVNVEKLELVFEVNWDHMPAGMMENIKQAAQKFGELTFTEADVQPGGKESKHLPGQPQLPLGGEEIK